MNGDTTIKKVEPEPEKHSPNKPFTLALDGKDAFLILHPSS